MVPNENFKRLKAAAKKSHVIQTLKHTSPEKVDQLLAKTKTELQIHQVELELQNHELILARNQAEKNSRYFEDLFELSPFGVMLTNENGYILKLNSEIENILEKKRSELLNKAFAQFASDESKNTFHLHVIETIETEEVRDTTMTLKIGKSTLRTVRLISRTYKQNKNSTKFVLSTIEDISEKTLLHNELKIAAKVFENATEGILICDVEFNIIQHNEAIECLTELSTEKFDNHSLLDVFSHLNCNLDIEELKTLKSGNSLCIDTLAEVGVKKHLINLHCNFVKLKNNQQQLFIIFISDFTREKQVQDKLKHSAYFDALTNLPNRAKILDEIKAQITIANKTQSLFAVVFIDFDGFKAINDMHGHDVGDDILKSVAMRLSHALRSEDSIGRIGGDEFVIIFKSLNNREDCEALIKRLFFCMTEPVKSESLEFKLTFSAGLTFYPQSKNLTEDQLLRQADHAMYVAKMNGKNRFEIYRESTEKFWQVQANHVKAILNALDRNQFVFFYQPIVDKSGKVRCYEALLRWKHPKLGIVEPNEIFTTFNTKKLNLEIDKWVIEHSFFTLTQWKSKNLWHRLSINVSADFFESIDSLAFMETLEKKYPIVNKHDFELEIVENTLIDVLDEMNKVIPEFKRRGYLFLLDDFGTGYSSLSYFRVLPAHVIKIDKSFVNEILLAPEAKKLCQFIIELAHTFDKKIIAEGIENEEQFYCLLDMNCDYFQGFVFSKPLSESELLPEISNTFDIPRASK